MVVVASCYGMRIGNPTLTFNATVSMTLSDFYNLDFQVSGLFVPLHFRSRERKVHTENFRSCGTFVPWNLRSHT